MGKAARNKWRNRAITLVKKVVSEGEEKADEYRKRFKKDKLDEALRRGPRG